MAGVVEFTDPRLTAIYDAVNPAGPDTDFYVRLADELAAERIVDLGCGTGLLISRLARDGRRCTGIDPAPEMLAVARRRALPGEVTWLDGAADAVGDWSADLAVMTGHVAQIVTDDDAWRATLSAVHGALRPGGVLAFESRNPTARTWLRWTAAQSRRAVTLPGGEAIELWYDVVAEDGDRVTHEGHYRWPESGAELVSTLELRYRTEVELTTELQVAGFTVERVFGDWDRSPVRTASPELIVVARR